MHNSLESSWQSLLNQEFTKKYWLELEKEVTNAYANGPVFPAEPDLFAAFKACPFLKVKVVILGQDPYHGAGQAHGLSFSVPEGVAIPPSLRNIFKELKTDTGSRIPASLNLMRWAKQGVLLLNSTLTVLPHQPGSHQKLGWETFTDSVISSISTNRENLVFILWGKFAQAKAGLVDESKHIVLQAPHPSPFSAHTGFFGSRPFTKTNDYLLKHKKEPISW